MTGVLCRICFSSFPNVVLSHLDRGRFMVRGLKIKRQNAAKYLYHQSLIIYLFNLFKIKSNQNRISIQTQNLMIGIHRKRKLL
jgi:hypothetical protein